MQIQNEFIKYHIVAYSMHPIMYRLYICTYNVMYTIHLEGQCLAVHYVSLQLTPKYSHPLTGPVDLPNMLWLALPFDASSPG